MNCAYEMIVKENAGSFSSAQLIEMYNDAVETIWFLQKRLQELSEENSLLWDDYEKLSYLPE